MRKIEKIANLILASPLEQQSLLRHLHTALSISPKLLERTISRLIEDFGEGNRPSVRAVSEWLENRKNNKFVSKVKLTSECEPAEMAPCRFQAKEWTIPSITTLGKLSDWLDIPHEKLDWFAGNMNFKKDVEKLQHYHLKSIKKRNGNLRLLEVPKWNLKQVQRHILHGILDHIPAHSASHGFQRGRSIFSYVKAHVGKASVLKFDLKDYFLTAERSRVRALFHKAGYPPQISNYLAKLCTHSCIPPTSLGLLPNRLLYEIPHLPQGAPSSPALADKLLFKVDKRIESFCRSLDKLQLNNSRYADDFAISSDCHINTKTSLFIQDVIQQIINDEGWQLNTKKTKVMHKSQRQSLAGIVINSKTNVVRYEYDKLRAILHNIQKEGWESQNRNKLPHFPEHLLGRIEFMKQSNPNRGDKLHQLYERMIENQPTPL